MGYFIDQMNNKIHLDYYPSRIISLVPSQTELLYTLGLSNRVVGITKFCIHPKKWFRTKNRIGGTKNVDIQKVKNLKPDLIIGNKEENNIKDIQSLDGIAPIWMSDIYTLDDAYSMIKSIGQITGIEALSKQLVIDIKNEFQNLKDISLYKDLKGKTVQYFMWHNPDMVAGKSTFINCILEECGFINLTKENRYPEVSLNVNPDFVFLSSEPFPFGNNHLSYFKDAFPNSKIVFVDGEMFSWYGSRLKIAPSYFQLLFEKMIS